MRIVSGGQTGADRAALDVALELGLESGGWVPLGRQAEDGTIPDHYPNLREADSPDPAVRTDSRTGRLSLATALTESLVRKLGKPLLHLDLEHVSESEASGLLRTWLRDKGPDVLNIAGARKSEDPSIYAATRRLLMTALGRT